MNTLRDLVRNSLLAMLFYLSPRLANVLIFIIIGRLAGPSQAGIFVLGATYLLIFSVMTRGLDDLLVRQVAREPQRAVNYLVNFFTLRLLLALFLYFILSWIVRTLFAYGEFTQTFILVISLSLIPDSLIAVVQALRMGQNRFSAPAWIITGMNLLKLLLGVILLQLGTDLLAIAWIWVLGSTLGLLMLVILVSRDMQWWRRSNLTDWSPLRKHWRTAMPFLAITTLLALEGQIDTLILSRFHSEQVVGWYGAATTVTSSLAMLSQAYRLSVFPIMTRYASEARDKLELLHAQSLRYLGMLALPMVAGIMLLAPQIVETIFGSAFMPTAQLLFILAPILLFLYLNVPNSRVMFVYDRQRWNLFFLFTSFFVNTSLNLWLVPDFGALGSSLARLTSVALYFLLNYLYVSQRLMAGHLLTVIYRPFIATAIMAAVVWPLRLLPLWIPIVAGAVIYALAIMMLRAVPVADRDLFREALGRRHKNSLSDQLSKSAQ